MESELYMMVAGFHEKMGLPVGQSMTSDCPDSPRNDQWLDSMGAALVHISKEIEGGKLKNTGWDHRLNRVHLMMEELGETMQAMARGDELETYDGLIDLLYVTIGSFVQLGLPMRDGFIAVHQSNMTKTRAKVYPDGRVRFKGPDYQPPSLLPILQARAYPED